MSMRDWVPRLRAAVGEPDIKEKLRAGHEATGKTFKVHLDGYFQQLPHVVGSPGVRGGAIAGHHAEVRRHVQGVSTSSKTCQVQCR